LHFAPTPFAFFHLGHWWA